MAILLCQSLNTLLLCDGVTTTFDFDISKFIQSNIYIHNTNLVGVSNISGISATATISGSVVTFTCATAPAAGLQSLTFIAQFEGA